MAATNWHAKFWAAVQAKFAASPNLVAWIPDGLWLDGVPEKNPQTSQPVRFPRMTMTQTGGGTNQTNCGPSDQAFFVRFECDAGKRSEVEQIGWELCEAFDNWSGNYDGINIRQTDRNDPPLVTVLDGPGEFGVSVDFSITFEGA